MIDAVPLSTALYGRSTLIELNIALFFTFTDRGLVRQRPSGCGGVCLGAIGVAAALAWGWGSARGEGARSLLRCRPYFRQFGEGIGGSSAN